MALATLSLAVAWLLTAATDEGGVPWTMRAARVLPIAPACTAIGTALALARTRARGEELALETLGASPLRRAASAVGGGSVPAVLAALAVALVPAVDARVFFPMRQAEAELRYVGGAFVDPPRGISVGPDGVITRSVASPGAEAVSSSTPASAPPPRARTSAAAAVLAAGLALAMLAARVRRSSWARAAVATTAAVVASIVLFHAAAARVVPALLAAAPSLALFALAASGYVVRAGDDARAARREKAAG